MINNAPHVGIITTAQMIFALIANKTEVNNVQSIFQ